MNNNLILLVLLLRKPTPQAYDQLTEYLKINDVNEIANNPTLQNTILSQISFLEIDSMNKFHKVIGETLRNNQQQQKSGSVVDLFYKNMLLMFNQMDFNQLLKAWDDFKHCQENYLQNNPFLTESYIETLLNKLQDQSCYQNTEELKPIIEAPIYNENCKINYLKALLYAILRYPFRAVKFSRKYYDMTLSTLVPKKVNHCIMNSIYLNMKMNFYDEALNSLSEGLRLSQTVSDEASINLCLLNLFEIAYRNNYQKQATLLLEYAVNHAQQLSPQQKLQNSLIYGAQIRYKTIPYSLLKKKNINWKDIIHQSLKQILQSHTPEIEQALIAYTLTCSNYQGHETLIQNALEQIPLYAKSDQSLSLQLESLAELAEHHPIYTLQKFQECFDQTFNLSDQMILSILNTCLWYFETINEPMSIKYIKSMMINLLEMNPDPYISESIGLIPVKNPRLKVKQLLRDPETDLEIIQLCKQYRLPSQYLDYKLKKIEILLQNNRTLEAQTKLNAINLEVFAQASCATKAKYWNLMGRAHQNLEYYQVSINLAARIGWLSLLRQNYYYLTFIYHAQERLMCRTVQQIRRFDELMCPKHQFRVLQSGSGRNSRVLVPVPHTNPIVIYSEEYLIYNQMAARKRIQSFDNNKIFLPSVFIDSDLSSLGDAKSYLSKLNQRSRTKSRDQPIQVRYKLEQDKDIVFAFEDQFSYQKTYTNKLQIKQNRNSQKYKELAECYCQKPKKKKSQYQPLKLDLDFL